MQYQLAAPAVGDLVADCRRRQRLSQRRLALRAGTSQAAISRIERGIEAPTPERLRNLLLVMGYDVLINVSPLPASIRSHDPQTSADRLFESASWNRLATGLEIAGQQARRAGQPATQRGAS